MTLCDINFKKLLHNRVAVQIVCDVSDKRCFHRLFLRVSFPAISQVIPTLTVIFSHYAPRTFRQLGLVSGDLVNRYGTTIEGAARNQKDCPVFARRELGNEGARWCFEWEAIGLL